VERSKETVVDELCDVSKVSKSQGGFRGCTCCQVGCSKQQQQQQQQQHMRVLLEGTLGVLAGIRAYLHAATQMQVHEVGGHRFHPDFQARVLYLSVRFCLSPKMFGMKFVFLLVLLCAVGSNAGQHELPPGPFHICRVFFCDVP
jgi:hypothetical protein